MTLAIPAERLLLDELVIQPNLALWRHAALLPVAGLTLGRTIVQWRVPARTAELISYLRAQTGSGEPAKGMFCELLEGEIPVQCAEEGGGGREGRSGRGGRLFFFAVATRYADEMMSLE